MQMRFQTSGQAFPVLRLVKSLNVTVFPRATSGCCRSIRKHTLNNHLVPEMTGAYHCGLSTQWRLKIGSELNEFLFTVCHLYDKRRQVQGEYLQCDYDSVARGMWVTYPLFLYPYLSYLSVWSNPFRLYLQLIDIPTFGFWIVACCIKL